MSYSMESGDFFLIAENYFTAHSDCWEDCGEIRRDLWKNPGTAIALFLFVRTVNQGGP